MAVGLQPNYRLCHQINCEMKYSRELGGFVPLRNKYLQTSNSNVYLAGDCAGIEEATTAMMEGKLAGLAAAVALGYHKPTVQNEMGLIINKVDEFRSSPPR